MEKRYKLTLLLGVIVILIPFWGIPQIFKDIALYAIGLIFVVLSIIQRNQYKRQNSNHEESVYVENEKASVSNNEVVKNEESIEKA